MICPVSVKAAVDLERDAIAAVHAAREEGRLDEAISIMLDYVAVSMVHEMIADIDDMLSDPSPVGPCTTVEEFNRVWGDRVATPRKEPER